MEIFLKLMVGCCRKLCLLCNCIIGFCPLRSELYSTLTGRETKAPSLASSFSLTLSSKWEEILLFWIFHKRNGFLNIWQDLVHTFSPLSIILSKLMLTWSHRSDGLRILRTVCDVSPTQQALGNFTSSGIFTWAGGKESNKSTLLMENLGQQKSMVLKVDHWISNLF